MSLETEIAELAAAYMSLKQRYESKPDVFDERLAQFTASFQSTIENLDAGDIWLDQQTGDDANDGHNTRPVATLSRAVSLIPLFGGGTIQLAGDYAMRDSTTIEDKSVSIKLNNHRIDQIASSTKLGRIELAGRAPHCGMSEGTVSTALFDSNRDTRSHDTSFFKRRDGTTPDISMFRVGIQLGDHGFASVGQTYVGHATLSYGHGGITRRDGATAPPLLMLLEQATLSFTWSTSSLASDLAMSDLFAGVVRADDGEPRNVVSNITI